MKIFPFRIATKIRFIAAHYIILQKTFKYIIMKLL